MRPTVTTTTKATTKATKTNRPKLTPKMLNSNAFELLALEALVREGALALVSMLRLAFESLLASDGCSSAHWLYKHQVLSLFP